MKADSLVFRPIGFARTPFTETSQISRGIGAKHTREGTLQLLPEMEDGLLDIEGFSHLFVLWVFDRSTDYELVSRPPTDDRSHGVFATRSPRRPNPIALSVVRLVERRGRELAVRGVDMLDASPILDIKPYLSSVPSGELSRGWIAEAEKRTGAGEDRTWSDRG